MEPLVLINDFLCCDEVWLISIVIFGFYELLEELKVLPMLVFHEQSQVDNDEGDRSGNTRGAMDVDFVLLLVLQLVELLGSLV